MNGKFLSREGGYADRPGDALEVKSLAEALHVCKTHHVKDCEMVLWFEETNEFVATPLYR